MSRSRPRYLLILAFVGCALGALAANAAQSLPEAVSTLDAKYLEVPQIDANDETLKIEAGDWEEEAPVPEPQEIEQGPVRVTLTYRESADEGGVTENTEDSSTERASEGEIDVAAPEQQISRIPIVTVFADGEEVAKLEGDPGSTDPPVAVQIAELDPSSATPEIVVSFYTGGAHCCSDTKLVTRKADGSGWETIEVGTFDGGPLTAIDLTGDGVYEFETRDNAFLYAFGCYACSAAPLQVLALEDGKIKNVSSDPRFRRAHEVWLKDLLASAPEEETNGFLAGYVGQKIRLGEGKQAWALMLDHYDRTSDWGLEVCEQPMNENGECPVPTALLNFPDALERMLNENGYRVEK